MKACKNHIHHLEEQCEKISHLIEELLMPQMPREQFVRVLTRTAKNLDHSVTDLYHLSHDLKSNNMAEASNWLHTIQHDFSKASKIIWQDCIHPFAQEAAAVTKDTIERIKAMLQNILKTIKEDMKKLFNTDKSIHSQDTHTAFFIKPKAAHKKYEGKSKNKKEEKEEKVS